MKQQVQITIMILGLAALLFASCSTVKKSAKAKQIPCKEMQPLEATFKTDPFTLDSVWIDDNCLNLVVRYDGGCGTAECGLYHTNKILQSYPPKTALWIKFTDNDPCRSEVTKQFRFKLTPFENYALNGGILFTFTGTGKRVLFKKSEH